LGSGYGGGIEKSHVFPPPELNDRPTWQDITGFILFAEKK